MQREGNPAKSVTADEFTHVMRGPVKQQVLANLISRHPETYGTNPVEGLRKLRWMIDGARFHSTPLEKEELFESMGMSLGQRLPHPPLSPDFQAPIEQCHSWVVSEVKRRFLIDPTLMTDPATVKRTVESVFWDQRVVNAQRVGAAFDSCWENMKFVDISKGNWGLSRRT